MTIETRYIRDSLSEYDEIIGQYTKIKPISIFLDIHGIGTTVGTANEYPMTALPMNQKTVDFTLSLIDRIDNQFGIDFIISESLNADIDIHLTTSDPVGEGAGGRAYYMRTTQERSFTVDNAIIGWDKKKTKKGKTRKTPIYGTKEVTEIIDAPKADITLHGDTFDINRLDGYAQFVIVHELGHALGLEHPFEARDGDVYGDTNSTNRWQTVMAYGPSAQELGYKMYPDYFTALDQQALYEIYGQA